MMILIFLPFIDLLVSMVFVLKVTTILETFVFANLDGVKKLAINAYLIGNAQIKVSMLAIFQMSVIVMELMIAKVCVFLKN